MFVDYFMKRLLLTLLLFTQYSFADENNDLQKNNGKILSLVLIFLENAKPTNRKK